MYQFEPNKIFAGKCEYVLKDCPDNYFDSVVTDAPYGMGKPPDIYICMQDWINHGYHEVKSKGGFMNKEWDKFVPQPNTWKEVYRVLKPGAFILVACSTRTQDLMSMSLRFGGFIIRDVIAWHYGEGFPKSVNISKAIDKEAGAERKVIATKETKSGGMASVNRTNKEQGFRPNNYNEHGNKFEITESATDADKQYEGYGTALKPATELWTLAQKPISEKTIVQNILKWGTGCLNIDGCRIAFVDQADQLFAKFGRGTEILSGNYVAGKHSKSSGRTDIEANPQGRWPANVVIDPYMAEFMDQQSGKNCGAFAAVPKRNRSNNVYGKFETFGDDGASFRGDTGGASRFFYCAKPSDNERNKGFNTTELKKEFPNGNDHITVKPVSLMRWLVKLVTPKGGIMLDNFCGSGTGLIGAKMENINYVGIDMDPRNVRISEIRVNAWNPYKYVPQELFNQ